MKKIQKEDILNAIAEIDKEAKNEKLKSKGQDDDLPQDYLKSDFNNLVRIKIPIILNNIDKLTVDYSIVILNAFANKASTK